MRNLPDWQVSGDKGSQFGIAVSAAGDVDNDGFDDVIVGANEYKVAFGSSGDPKSGAAFLFLGSENGLSESHAWSYLAEAAGIQFGYSVAGAGDVNHDGYDDILVGAPSFDSSKGKAFLFFGTENGLTEAPAWTYTCSQAASRCAAALSSAGDINNDGFDDWVIGAPNYNNPEIDEGAVLVFLGSDQGLSDAPDWIFESDQVGAEFGESVTSAGDVNGDGNDDLIIGAPYLDHSESMPNYGGAFLYLGSPSRPGPGYDTLIYGLETNAVLVIRSDRLGISTGTVMRCTGRRLPIWTQLQSHQPTR